LRALAYNVELKDEAESQGFALISAGINLAAAGSDEDRQSAAAHIETFRIHRCDPHAEEGIREDVAFEERKMTAAICNHGEDLLSGAGPPPEVLSKMFSRRFRVPGLPAPTRVMEQFGGSNSNSPDWARRNRGGEEDSVTDDASLVSSNWFKKNTAQEEEATDKACAKKTETHVGEAGDYLSWSGLQGSNAKDSGESAEAAVVSAEGKVRSIADVLATLNKPENQPVKIFPTLFSRVNFADYFGREGLARLGEIANTKYVVWCVWPCDDGGWVDR
jgi:hypothetical protein